MDNESSAVLILDRKSALKSSSRMRDGRLTLLRIIATFMIVAVHISGAIRTDWNHPHWWAGNFYDGLGQLGVPIFLMVTGALLLGQNDGAIAFWRKRAVRLVPPTCFWACIYLYIAGVPLSEWAWRITTTQVESFHLWYLYMLLGLSVGLPIVSAFYRSAKRSDLWYYAAVWMLFAIIVPLFRVHPFFKETAFAADVIGSYGVFTPLSYMGYVFIGACIYHAHHSTWIAILGWIGFLMGAGGLMLWTYLVSASSGKLNVSHYQYMSPFIALGSIGLFSAFVKMKIVENKILRRLGDCCLGIYLVHLAGIRYAASWGFNGASGNPWISVPYTMMVVVVASALLISVIRLFRPGRWIT